MKKAICITLIISLLAACKKDRFYQAQVKLKFSTDTVFFDTIFTQIGSATQIIKVYNTTPEFLNIDYIRLANSNSPFRLNINGQATNNAQNVIIPPKDSIYIFAEVTINPNKGYLIEQDSILFAFNGNIQSLTLLAIGWDVHLIKQKIITDDTNWNGEKPYLIWDYLIVDTNALLQINPDTKIFLHRNAGIFVFGSIKTYGTLDSPVIFSTDRLEKDYQDIPGLWGGIILERTSQKNEFHWTTIKNSIVGISADSVQDTIVIHNCQITHQSYANIFASQSIINIFGSLLSDAGWYNLGVIKGGTYLLINNTIANYYGWGTIRQTPAVAITNYQIINNQIIYHSPINLTIANSIIYGNLENELVLSPAQEWDNFNYTISNCLIKTKEDYIFSNSIINKDPKFKDITKYDFHLTAESPAINQANYSYIQNFPRILSIDLDGNFRNNPSDIGCYEYQDK